MIDEICVSNIALIQEASIQPAPGLTAITGETGAGKTALLSACRLLSGQRADKQQVREGASEASVSGRFYLGEPTGTVDGEEDGLEREMVVSRRISADGRSRVKIDGQIASVGELSSAVAPMIDLCSQHDQQALLHAASHKAYLDEFAGAVAKEASAAYSQAYARMMEAKEHLDGILSASEVSQERLDEARYVVCQVDEVLPSAEDYEELAQFVRISENAEALARTSNEAYDALCSEGGALDQMNAAIALIEEGAAFDDKLQAHADSLREASYIAEDAAREVLRYRDAIDLDMSTLEQAQERMSAYQTLMRKFGPTLDDVLAHADDARRTIQAADGSEEALSSAKRALSDAEEELSSAANVLHDVRQAAAPELSHQISVAMSRLEMGSASIECNVQMMERPQWTESGPDRVELLFRPSSGMGARPLSKVASGGELSRVMLALHVVMKEAKVYPALVFDEIDAGVGGSVGNALAEVLEELSHTHQVIVVTHLAQVASRADKQYVALKDEADGVAVTRIHEVTGDERVAEVARMLSGSTSDTSLAHARELLGIS
ncbi:MAG: DNA repair protein RecN [Eggerthellaceae bacterium]|nr:DNA repair protein RecN [Eggerthellaceae bacterium]